MNARPDFNFVPPAPLRPGALSDGLRCPNLGLLLALAWVVVALQLLIMNWTGTADTLSDTDDAMRLVELRAFLAGAGWFDLHEPRVAPPFGYDTHWSRLIDAGLAGLFWLFRPFTDVATAERLMRVAWPLIWLIPAMGGAMAAAARLAGREGALIALLFAVVGLPAMMQFVPGRIDHHNVQIALTTLALAATMWSDRRMWSAVAAGFLSALALAIGFECLPFIAACGAAFAVRFVFDGAAARTLTRYGLALASGAAAAWFVDAGPQRLAQTACDSMAINSALALIAVGVLLPLAARFDGSVVTRLAAVAAAGLVGALVYVGVEPRCLGGPFAMIDRAAWPIWLDHVQEMQPLLVVLRETPVIAVAVATFPAFAVVAAFALAREADVRRDFAYLVIVAQLLIAAVLTLATVKVYSYAMWFAMPLVTLLTVRVIARLTVTSVAARACTAIFFAPAVVSAVAITLAQITGASPGEKPAKRTCFRNDSYAALAALPRGLLVADIDYGPFILALTPHSALAGPYHRMSASILASHEIFARPPEQARELLTRLDATYVALCGPRGPVGLGDRERAASLWGVLNAGRVPDWLDRVPSTPGQAFAVYRLRNRG